MTKSLSICLLVLLAGCNAPNNVGRGNADAIAEKLTYFKDRHGICYAAIASVNSYGSINSITAVPCEKVGL